MKPWLLALVAVLCAQGAEAKVTLTFYSRELGATFPHAFVRLTGATDAAPERTIDANYGFTARHTTPAILSRPVLGEIVSVGKGYVAHSDGHLALVLSDDQYAVVLSVIERWRALPQPSYALHARNCVFFVGDVARALGMTVDDSDPRLMVRPRSYLLALIRLNPTIGTVLSTRRSDARAR